MTNELVMPQLGMTMTEGTVLQWLKAVGDPVIKGEPIVAVQTDKVDMEVESPFAGFLTEIVVAEGVTVPVATRIGCIGEQPGETCESSDASSVPEAVEAAVGDAPEEQQWPATTSDPIALSAAPRTSPLVSPRARRVASELGVDVSAVSGSGEFGRIREADVRAHVAQLDQAKVPKVAEAAGTPASTTSKIRRIIADRLTESVATVPQFWLAREVDASAVVALRQRLLPELERRTGARVSFTDFFVKAIAVAMEQMPVMRQRWGSDGLEPVDYRGVGLAVQAPDRLIVPVLSDPAKRTMSGLVAERARLVTRAQENRLSADELEGACGSLSNLGAWGVDEFQAIINPPQSFILATGRLAKRPIVVEDEIAVRPTVRLVLTVDHRVADGVAGAQFLSKMAEALESPESLLL